MSARWLILWLSALAGLLPASAWACSCNPGEKIDSVVERWDAIFRGRVLSVERPGMFDADKWPKGVWIVRFEVITAWKGVTETELVVTTNVGSDACGITFKKDMEYLVFASPRSRDTTLLWTSVCHHTNEFRADSKDLQYIEAHLAPLPLKPKSPPPSSCAATGVHSSWTALLLLAGLLRRVGQASGPRSRCPRRGKRCRETRTRTAAPSLPC